MTRSVDSTANLITGLQILQSLGDAIPAGGIVKSVAGIGITLLETAEVSILLPTNELMLMDDAESASKPGRMFSYR